MAYASIKESKEAALALASLITAGIAANADGKVSPFEVVSILAGNTGKLLDAVKGMKEIPGELKDLDEEELRDLSLAIADAIAPEGVDNHARAKAFSLIDLLGAILSTYRTFADTPKAEPVP